MTTIEERSLSRRNKVVTLSAAMLFIAVTKILPGDLAMLGLKLNGHRSEVAFALLAAYFMVALPWFIYTVLSIYERVIIPRITAQKWKHMKSPILGESASELVAREDVPPLEGVEGPSNRSEFQAIEREINHFESTHLSRTSEIGERFKFHWDYTAPLAFSVLSLWLYIPFTLSQ